MWSWKSSQDFMPASSTNWLCTSIFSSPDNFFVSWDRVSLYSSGTCYVYQGGLKLKDPPACVSWVMGFKCVPLRPQPDNSRNQYVNYILKLKNVRTHCSLVSRCCSQGRTGKQCWECGVTLKALNRVSEQSEPETDFSLLHKEITSKRNGSWGVGSQKH